MENLSHIVTLYFYRAIVAVKNSSESSTAKKCGETSSNIMAIFNEK